MNTKIKIMLFLLAAVCNLVVASQYVWLTMDDYEFNIAGDQKYLCTTDEVCRWMPREGLYTEPWFSTDAYRGEYSLGMQLPAAESNPNLAGRSELFVVAPDDTYTLKFGEKKYFGFAMKLDKWAFDMPLNWCLFTQVFQNQDPWIYSPPFALDFKIGQDNPIQYQVETIGTAGLGSTVRYTGDINRDQWYKFVLALKPGYNGDGTIELWVDDVKVYDAQQDWGYAPGTYEGTEVNDSFNFRVGLYRREQPRAFTVYYDQVKYGDSYEEADPGIAGGCGDLGYFGTDINKDCYADIQDFALLANQWLQDTNPAE